MGLGWGEGESGWVRVRDGVGVRSRVTGGYRVSGGVRLGVRGGVKMG